MGSSESRSRSSSRGSEDSSSSDFCARCLKLPADTRRIASADTKSAEDTVWDQVNSSWFKVPTADPPIVGGCKVCGVSLSIPDERSSETTAPPPATAGTAPRQRRSRRGDDAGSIATMFVEYSTGEMIDAEAQDLPTTRANCLRVIAVSDTHDSHSRLRTPPGDVLIHAGDILLCSRRFSVDFCKRKLRSFNVWLGEQPQDHKFVVAGNHDIGLELMGPAVVQAILSNATYLCNTDTHVPNPRGHGGLRLFGSPFSRGKSNNRGFQPGKFPRDELPDDVRNQRPHTTPPLDILITHEPIRTHFGNSDAKPAKMHIGGHLHAMYGAHDVNDTLCLVACSMDGKYRVTNSPIVVDVPCR